MDPRDHTTKWLTWTITWLSLDDHMIITWLSLDHHMTVTWPSHDCHRTITWLSHDHHMTVTWPSHDCHLTITWLSPDHHMTVTWSSHDCHMIITWLAWPSHDCHMIITWPLPNHLTTWLRVPQTSLEVWTCTSFSSHWRKAPLQDKIWELPENDANLDMLQCTHTLMFALMSVCAVFFPAIPLPTLHTVHHSPHCTLYSNPWRNWTIRMGWRRSWLPEGTFLHNGWLWSQPPFLSGSCGSLIVHAWSVICPDQGGEVYINGW